ncbi:MAG: PKD domain-containing protein [Bacteroidota bacterium]
MSDKMNIEELFRSKLGEAEITPSTGSWKGVQRQLRMKKFLRFDPGSFNVFYMGGIVVAGAAVATLLLTNRPLDGTVEPAAGPAGSAEPTEQLHEPVITKTTTSSREEASEADHTQNPIVTGQNRESQNMGTTGQNRDHGSHQLQTDPQQTGSQQTASQHTDLHQSEKVTVPEQPVRHTLVTYFTSSATEGCAPLQVSFINASVSATSYSWSFGNGESSAASDPLCTFTEPGSYSVTLIAQDEAGMSKMHRQLVEVYPAPVAAFEIETGLEGADGTPPLEVMNYSTGAFSFAWDILQGDNRQESGNPPENSWSSNEFQPSIEAGTLTANTGSIRLVATNNRGCSDTSIVKIPTLVGSGESELRFPNVFSASPTGPSGGAYSPNELRTDLFHPHFTEAPGEYHLKIFSRMGELLFETRDIYQGWDGYVNQERAFGGVYLWVTEGKWESGSAFSQKGDVTLLWGDRR